MKDIDFDELDRAVSSVLGQSAKGGDEKPTDDVKKDAVSPEDTSDMDRDEATGDRADVSGLKDSAPEAPKPATTPLAIKRRGKFMDVMHPSADMKPSSSTPAKAALPRPVITPLLTEEAESSVEHTAEPTAVVDEAQAMIGAEPAAVLADPSLSDSAVKSEDASDELRGSLTMGVDEDKNESLPMAATVGGDAEVPDGANDPQSTADQEPDITLPAIDEVPTEVPTGQATPFLSDTQVEKRPLGAFGEAEVDTAASDGSADTPLTTADTQAAPVMSLPRELQPDVVGVESVQENEAMETPTGPASPFAAKVGVAPEAGDGRVEGHPLFDTSTYHEPIAAVHHGAFPGWAKWLIGLLICLAIGAGVGYFLFTTGL